MKAQPLTVKEQFIVHRMNATYFAKYKWDDAQKTSVYTKTPRDATSARRLIKGRKENQKYSRVLAAWRKVEAAIASGEYEQCRDAHYSLHYALKYQGYLQLQLVLAERAAEGKSDEDLAAMMVGDAL
jgi:hypothetical protein